MWAATRSSITLWMTCLATVAFAQTPNADALKHVPDDTALAIVVPSLDRLGSAVASFTQAIDAVMLPKLDREAVVESILSETFEYSDGLDTAGTFVAALMPSEDPQPVLICHLRDATAWKANADKADEADLYNIIVQGDDWLAAIKDDVLILSKDKAAIRAALGSKGKFAATLEKKSRGLLEKNQVVVLVDIAAWKDKIDQGLMMADQMVQLGMMMSGGPQAKAGVEVWKWVSKEFGALVAQTRTAVVGLRFAGDGIHYENHFTFSPDGGVAQYLSGVRKSKKHLLRGVGNGPFTFAFGSEWSTADEGNTLFSRLIDLLEKMAASAPSIDPAKLAAAIQKSKEMLKQVNGYSGVMRPVREGDGMIVSGAYFCEDPERIRRDMAAAIESYKDMMSAFSLGVEFEISTREEKIDGTDFIVIDYKMSSEDPTVAQALQSMYGDAPTMYMAVNGDDLVYVMGPKDTARQRIIKTMGESSSDLTANTRVAEAMRSIPPSPQLIALVDLGEFVKWSLKMAAASGAPVPPIEIKAAHAPLLVFAGYLDKDAARASTFLPSETIRKILNSVMPGGDADEAD